MTNNRIFAGALLAATALTFAAPVSAQRVDRIVAFGDSYADDGNFFALAGIPLPATGVYTTGRFSGGSNYIDTLGQILDAPIENFAIGGARTGIANQSNPFSWGFTYEVDQFLDVGAQSGVFPTIPGSFDEGDLVTVSIGGNDGRAYQIGGGMPGGAAAAAAVAVADASANLDRLVAAGAPTISFLAGNTGLLPEVNYYPDPAMAAAVRTAFSDSYAAGMQSTLAGYAAEGVMVHYLDLGEVLENVTADFEAFGLSDLACPAFPAPVGPGVPGSTACAIDSSAYLVYGDQLHLTSAGFAIVARYVAAQLTAPLTLQATSDIGLDVARQFGRTMSTRSDLGAPRDGGLPEGMGVYLVGDTVTRRVDRSDTNDSFKTTSTGATLGVEYGFGVGMVGAAANISRPKANFIGDAARTEGRSVQLGIYGSAAIAGGFVQGYAGHGWDDYDLTREGVESELEADLDGRHSLAGIKAGWLMPMGIVRVGPVISLDYARAKVDGYTEEGDDALSLNVDKQSYSSLRGSLGVEVRSDFDGGGVQLRPFASAAIEKDLDGDDRTFHFAQTSSPTIVNRWEVKGSNDAYGRLSAGFSAAILEGISLNVAGSATVAQDEGHETSAHLGFRAAF